MNISAARDSGWVSELPMSIQLFELGKKTTLRSMLSRRQLQSFVRRRPYLSAISYF